MTSVLITGAKVVRPEAVLEPGWVSVIDGRIAGVGEGQPPQSRQLQVDVEGRHVVPGFVDIHVHGGGGDTFTTADRDAITRVGAFHRAHGTTRSLASLVSAPPERVVAGIEALADVIEAGDGRMVGSHLEGPFLSKSHCGAHDPAQLIPPDPTLLGQFFAAGRGTVRMVTFAPELPGALGLVEPILAAGAIPAIGHTDATFAEARQAIEAGASVATHLFNGMRPMHHREPSVVGAALSSVEMTCELIVDLIHVHSAVLRTVFEAAGAGRIALVTDAMAGAGLGDGEYVFAGRTVTVKDGAATVGSGSLAGSTLTMDAAVARTVSAGVPIPDAVRAASLTPARLLGLDEFAGSIETGKVGDLVVLDESLHAEVVLLAGDPIALRPAWWPG